MLPKFSQTGYIGLTVISFLIVLSMILLPWKPPADTTGPCSVGEPPDNPPETLRDLPAIKNMFDTPRLGQDPDLTIGGPDPVEKSDFVMIRKNVPTGNKSTPADWTVFGGTEKTANTHTVNAGVQPQKPGYDAYYPSEWGEMDIPNFGRKYFRGEGLLLFANNDPSTIRREGDNVIYTVDVYQDIRIYEDPDRGYKDGDLFICGVDTQVGSTSVVVPGQDISPKKEQLQLEWFLFSGDKVWGVHCKPAVYLYPQRKQLVNVKVFPKGELSYTDPVYDPARGWTVKASPDGRLMMMNDEPIMNNYLYYESKILDFEIKKPSEGWVVSFDEMEDFYNQALPKLGLNEKEAKDFSEYWLKTLPESPYYFVGLIEKGQRDYLEPLSVTPNPDTSIRFSFYFEPLDQFKFVQEPKIETPERNGFTLVDWGGMVKLHPGTPFTCSQ